MAAFVDLSGKRFSLLQVIGRSNKQCKDTLWTCQCDCGETTEVRGYLLTSGSTKSCGCLRRANKGVPRRDLTGARFGRLLVLGLQTDPADKKIMWRALCDCGEETTVIGGQLTSGKTKSCGCAKVDFGKAKLQDITGKVFGRWEVLRRADVMSPHVKWVCRCSCGTEADVFGHNLTRGLSVSCGCHRSEATTKAKTTHGLSGTREYSTWCTLVQRMTNPNNTAYPYYGAKFDMDPRWLNFETFYTDMGPAPTDYASLEREEGALGYWPFNVIWADSITQANNRSSNRVLEFMGRSQTLTQWCRELNLSHPAVHIRITRRGWSTERALTTPTRLPFKEIAKAVLTGEQFTGTKAHSDPHCS